MLMHAMLSASTLILQPTLTGTAFMLWNMAIAAAMWIAVGAGAMGSRWPASRQPLNMRVA
jgi:hypothetical protein